MTVEPVREKLNSSKMAARFCPVRLSSLLFSPKVTTFAPAYFSTQNGTDAPVLVRDFIHAALYEPKDGYFSNRSGSVGVLDRSIKFNRLEGRKAYMQHLDKIYKQSDISWFTPVELFKIAGNSSDYNTYLDAKISDFWNAWIIIALDS